VIRAESGAAGGAAAAAGDGGIAAAAAAARAGRAAGGGDERKRGTRHDCVGVLPLSRETVLSLASSSITRVPLSAAAADSVQGL
jgi:hypothetical protein